MKILVISNLYPPHYIGGYELGCRDVVEGLRARGHTVQVLTSSFRAASGTGQEPGVERTLQFNGERTDPPHDKRAECGKLSQAVMKFQPDILYFWNQAGLCHWLPVMTAWQGCPMAFFLSDTNFVSWRVAAWLLGPAQKNTVVRALFGNSFLTKGRSVLENGACHFASEFLRDVAVKNGIAVSRAESLVAHWGIDQSQFIAVPRSRWPVKRLLYVGQMIEQKGIRTAILAMDRLKKDLPELTLSLVGGAYSPDYENQMRALTAELGLGDRVIFRGKVPRAELPRIYAEHDALVFPSEWDEPFAITPLEAIASGLAVVGTTTGGSGELFINQETAMTFKAGDVDDCARAIRELCADKGMCEFISKNAQRIVKERHTLDAMVDAIEAGLVKTASLHRP